MKKPIIRILKVVIILYCLIGIICYYGQDWILLHPKSVPRQTAYHFELPFTEVNIPYNQETNINIIQFHTNLQSQSSPQSPADTQPDTIVQSPTNVPHSSPAGTLSRGLVLYFHGNRDGVGHYAKYAKDFTSRGYDVWMIDYPGFGKSTGKFTEANVYEYALQEYKLARKQYQPRDIIIYGKSLGSGIAAQLASVRDCRRLILESPYFSMQALWRSWLPVYPWGSILHFRFPNWQYLPEVTAPITIFHGDHDRIIPHRQSARLAQYFKPGDQLITIPNAGHNGIPGSPLYQQTLDTLLK